MRSFPPVCAAFLLALPLAGLGCSSQAAAGGVDASAPADTGAADAGKDASRDAAADAATPAADADAARPADATHDAPPAPDASADAAAEASPDAAFDAATDPASLLGACLGPSLPLVVSAQMPYVSVPVGSESGDFVLDFGSTYSSIDLSAFASPGPQTSGCNASQLYVTCTVAGFAFFGPAASVPLTTESFAGVGGSLRQAGILGTDRLGLQVLTLDYASGLVYGSPASGFCSDAALMAAGFGPLDTTGFYENNLSLLVPATSVDSNAGAQYTVADVPTVPVAIAGVGALAQLDTGFDDSVTPFSVNVNEAFYMAVAAASPSALVRDTSLDATLSTCVQGVSEPVTGYRLAAGVTFDFKAIGGAVARSYPQAAIFVKNTPSAASSCGGIGTWTVPAAQVGASFYVGMKAMVFDPFAAKVWVPTH